MILKVVGLPYLRFLDILQLFSLEMGSPIMHVERASYAQGFRMFKPASKRMDLPERFAYATTVHDLLPLKERLNEADDRICVMVGGAPSLLTEYQIPIVPQLSLTPGKVLALANSHDPSMSVSITKVRSLNAEVVSNVRPSLLLQKMHPLFYRIPDKESRARAQNDTYNYLLGHLSKPKLTGNVTLDDLLTSSNALMLRKQISYARAHSIAEALELYPEMDEYEIRYFLSREALHANKKSNTKRN